MPESSDLQTDGVLGGVSLQELFTIPPEQLTDAQFSKIIEVYRSERLSWNAKETTKKAAAGAPKVAKGSVKPSLADLLG